MLDIGETQRSQEWRAQEVSVSVNARASYEAGAALALGRVTQPAIPFRIVIRGSEMSTAKPNGSRLAEKGKGVSED